MVLTAMAEERDTGRDDERDASRDEVSDTGHDDERDDSRDEHETGRDEEHDTGSDESDTAEPTAPSIGTKTKIEHVPPEERLAGHDHATDDAMGLDKRRAVKGETYGPTRTRVIMSFLVFFAIVGIVFVGLLFLVGQLDQAPDTVEAKAPWSSPDAAQEKPVALDERPDGAGGELDEQQTSSGSSGGSGSAGADQ